MEYNPDNKNITPPLRRGLGRLPGWVKNKYFISFAAFVTILLFLDKNDLFTQLTRSRELKKLQQTKEYYTSHIKAERKELEQLKNNPAILEKYAREKYLMKRDNEDLFVITEKYGDQKK
jgi:cell division protein DivIC